MKNTFLFILIILIASFISCKKDILIKDKYPNSIVAGNLRLTNQNIIDQTITDISKILAIAQKNADFREIMLNEAQLDILSENAILYFRIKDLNINSINITVKERFFELSDSLGFSYTYDYFDCDIVEDMPQLTFFLYFITDEISICELEYFPPTIVMPETSNFEQENDFSQESFDCNLESIFISNNIEPEDQNEIENEIIIIVSNYEGFLFCNDDYIIDNSINVMDRFGFENPIDELHDSIINALDNGNENLIIDISSSCLQGSHLIGYYSLRSKFNDLTKTTDDDDPVPPPPGEVCERDYYSDCEVLTKFKLQHGALKAFCKWTRKYVEIQGEQIFVVSSTDIQLGMKKPRSFLRKDVKKDKVISLGPDDYIHYLRWYYSEGIHGDVYKMVWTGINHKTGTEVGYEVGISVPVKIGVLTITTTGKYTSKRTIKDKYLGEDLIYYCDPISGNGTQYDGGLLQLFFMKENTI